MKKTEVYFERRDVVEVDGVLHHGPTGLQVTRGLNEDRDDTMDRLERAVIKAVERILE